MPFDLTDLVTYRYIGAYAGVPAFGLLAYRLVSTWSYLTLLSHLLGMMLTVYVAVGVGAQYRLIVNDAPGNEFSPVIAGLNVAVVLVALVWPRLVNRWPMRKGQHSE